MPNKQTHFHGILAVGRTKADAINNYRLLALNKGATVQVDSGRNLAFVTQASHADGMFNPQSGNMDLETDDTMVDKLEFQSNSSGEVEVNHLVCASGCRAHVVFDSEELVKFCPNCTASLSEASEEDEDEEGEESDEEIDLEAELGEDESSESADEESEEDTDEESSDEESEEDTDEESSEEDTGAEESDTAAEEESDEDEGEELPELTDDDGQIVISSDGNDDGLIVAASSFEEATALFRENLPAESLSAASDNVEAHYMVCANEECGAHLVSDKEIKECPACQSEAIEPKAAVEEEKKEEMQTDAQPAAAIEDPAAAVASEDEEESDDESGENTLELSDEEGNILTDETELDATEDVEDSESTSLDVSYSSNVAGQSVWTAFFKGTPVAMASKSSAGKNADIFDTPSFGHAVLATAKVAGVRPALKELGFQPLKHKVAISSAVKKMVDAQVAEAREAIATEQQQFKDRFSAALAAAAVGLNRGFFADKQNPIKATLWNAMASAGIRNPESMIDSVFKAHSDAYHKTLFELASDLTAKPVEVQESLSKAIHSMGYQAVSSSEGSIEGRLEQFGTSVSSGVEAVAGVTKDIQPAAAGVDRQQIKSAVLSLGRGRR